MSENIELISFKLCPFVQRSIILLNEKSVNFKRTFIDLNNKPSWFLELSPTGKVPVLKIGNEVLFESAVINEYLDEVYTPHIHPRDPLQKAKHRAWIEFSSGMFFDFIKVLKATDESEYKETLTVFTKQLAQLEKSLRGEFFDQEFSLVDIAFAPILLRIEFIKKVVPTFLSDFSSVHRWSENILARDSVKNSYDPDIEQIFIQRFQSQSSYLLNSGKRG